MMPAEKVNQILLLARLRGWSKERFAKELRERYPNDTFDIDSIYREGFSA